MFCYWIKSFAIYVSSFVSLSFLESNKNAIEKQKIKVSKQQNMYSSTIILALFLCKHYFQYLDHDEITSFQGQIRGKTFFSGFFTKWNFSKADMTSLIWKYHVRGHSKTTLTIGWSTKCQFVSTFMVENVNQDWRHCKGR